MRIKKKHNFLRLVVFVASALLVVCLYGISSSPLFAEVGWRDNGQCGMPSGSLACTVGAPINTSASTQIKTGPLTLENGLTISNPNGRHCSGNLSVACSGANQQIANKMCTDANAGNVCLYAADLSISGGLTWNGVTKSKWADIDLTEGQFVTLRTVIYNDSSLDETGYISVKGPNAAVGRVTAVSATAGPPPASLATTGILAADNSSSNLAYAVNAQTGSNGGRSNLAAYAYTTTNAKLSWAAYFRGDVKVVSPYDVIVSGTASPNSGPPGNDNKAELCIGDYCRDTWPTGGAGDDYWVDSSGYLQVKNPTWQLAIGGNTATAPFLITPVPPQTEANLTVRGFGTSSTLTIE